MKKYNENTEEWLRTVTRKNGGSNYEIGSRKALGKYYCVFPTYFILCLAILTFPLVFSVLVGLPKWAHVCHSCGRTVWSSMTSSSRGVDVLGWNRGTRMEIRSSSAGRLQRSQRLRGSPAGRTTLGDTGNGTSGKLQVRRRHRVCCLGISRNIMSCSVFGEPHLFSEGYITRVQIVRECTNCDLCASSALSFFFLNHLHKKI